MASSGKRSGLASAETDEMLERPLFFEDLHVGMEYLRSVVFTPDEVARFVKLVRDPNPIHENGKIIPGALLAARVTGIVADFLRLQFTNRVSECPVLREEYTAFRRGARAGTTLSYCIRVKEIQPEGNRGGLVAFAATVLVGDAEIVNGRYVATIRRRFPDPA